MASFSKVFTSLTGLGFVYERSSRHVSHVFGQEGVNLDTNHPRIGFEYYVDIKLNQDAMNIWGSIMTHNNIFEQEPFTSKFYSDETSPTLPDSDTEGYIGPVSTPAIDAVNTSSSSSIVAISSSANASSTSSSAVTDGSGRRGPEFSDIYPLVKSVEMPSMTINTKNLKEYNRHRISHTSIEYEPVKMIIHDTVDGKACKFWQMYYTYMFKDGRPATVSDGNTRSDVTVRNSKQDEFVNTIGLEFKDLFGLEPVRIRDPILTIDIYQIHGTKFNKVSLINPKIVAFTHDTMAYDKSEVINMTFTLEYEYAEYDLGRRRMDWEQLDRFRYGEYMDLPSLAITSFIQEKLAPFNPLLNSDSPILQRIGKNVQDAMGVVIGAGVSDVIRGASSSVLDGMADIEPKPIHPTGLSGSTVSSRSFAPSFGSSSGSYTDVLRFK